MKKFFYVRRLVMLVALTGLATVQLWGATYSRPASYTASAAYRTNKPEQKAVDIVNNQRLDSVRRTAPQDYIRRVCSEISSHTKDKFLQAKLAHDVTALLLFYDDANYWNNSVPQQDLASILKTRRAVCEGYANLFLALCDGIGLPCEKIHGYARGVGASQRGYEDPTDSNHAWNMVQIQGSWYLVDCTWDSGHMSGRTSVQDYSTTWLFIQPEQIIYSHYPSQYSHQTVAHSSTNQEPVQTLTHHTLMLEGSLGCQLIPHIVCYAGTGIGLSYIPENQEEGGGHIAKNVPWQVQAGARVSLLNLLYIRIQAVYLHTGKLLPSLHLGLPLF